MSNPTVRHEVRKARYLVAFYQLRSENGLIRPAPSLAYEIWATTAIRAIKYAGTR